jgi:hypothetical protein
MNPKDEAQLREEIKHMFASAWQDGVNHLNPKYLRRDTLFTDKVMKLLNRYCEDKVREARIDELSTLINKMNVGDEFLSEPTVNNKGWNGVILTRIAELQERKES